MNQFAQLCHLATGVSTRFIQHYFKLTSKSQHIYKADMITECNLNNTILQFPIFSTVFWHPDLPHIFPKEWSHKLYILLRHDMHMIITCCSLQIAMSCNWLASVFYNVFIHMSTWVLFLYHCQYLFVNDCTCLYL